MPFSFEQRLLLLDVWRRSGLPAGDFAPLVGLSKFTLYEWKRRFEADGPAGLADRPRGSPHGARLPEVTRRTIVMLKQAHPEWGCQRISDTLLRGPALSASPAAVARVLHEAGYQLEDEPTHPHPAPERRFERARPNQLWQTDLFTFVLDQPSCCPPLKRTVWMAPARSLRSRVRVRGLSGNRYKSQTGCRSIAILPL